MNSFGAIALLMFVVIGGVACVYVIATGMPATPFVDSEGNTTSLKANNTSALIGNATAPISGVIGGGILIILAVFLIAVLVTAILASQRGGYSQSRYH